MALRIVVGFLTQIALGRAGSADAHLQRLVSLRERADAYGGRLSALGSQTVAFDFGPEDLEESLSFALTEHHDGHRGVRADSALWAVGIAQGEMEPLVDNGSLLSPSWGVPLVIAISLARSARPGEVLIDPDMPAVQTGEVLTWGARVAKEGPVRVRGLIVDPRGVFRRDAALHLTQLGRPALIGRDEVVQQLLHPTHALTLLRADPGCGGSRLLEEVETHLLPARSLYVCTAGAEPLGALRRALSAALAAHGRHAAHAFDQRLHGALERLLAGDGVPLSMAGELVAAWIAGPRVADGGRDLAHGLVLIDDAMEIDDPSLEAVVMAVLRSEGAVRVLARVEQGASVPAPLASLPRSQDVVIGPLARGDAEDLANALTSGQLTSDAAKRWARRGRFVPLGVVEAVAEAVSTGELSWSDGAVAPRSRTTGVALGPSGWISRRLAFLAPDARQVLAAIATLGAEVPARMVHELLAALQVEGGPEQGVYLARTGWLRVTREGFYVIPSRTHRAVILDSLLEEERARIHRGAWPVLAKLAGKMAQVEAARHAALAGDPVRATQLALRAARAALDVGLESAAEALLAFADATREDLDAEPAVPPLRIDSWLDALRAQQGHNGSATRRLEAIAALTRGETTEALIALREGVREERDHPPLARSRAWLALAVGLGVAGRAHEALFAGLEALARARESEEQHGEEACVRFLAKLSLASGHPEAAVRWQTARAEAR